MYRDEVVKLMSDAIDNMNRQGAQQSGIPESQIEEFITSGRTQLDFVNGMLYDILKNNGVIG
jgi:hypothetical protein